MQSTMCSLSWTQLMKWANIPSLESDMGMYYYTEHILDIQGMHSAATLAQSAARQSHNLKVVSSSLTGGTFFAFYISIHF